MEVKVEYIGFNMYSKTLRVSESFILDATVLPSYATCTCLYWESSAPKTVSIDSESGYMRALKTGEAIITAYSTDGSNIQRSCKIIVIDPINVESISLSKQYLNLKVGDYDLIEATIRPSNATNQSITWSSNNPLVARVYFDGGVYALSPGTATITAKTADGNKIAQCTVTVEGPGGFKYLLQHDLLYAFHIEHTEDDFYIATKPLSGILASANIGHLIDQDNKEAQCYCNYDDWYIYAAPTDDDSYVYGLYKLREEESDFDGGNGDGDNPGVTISFVEFDMDILNSCVSCDTDENLKALYTHIQHVVSDEGAKHNSDIYKYFQSSKSEAPYLIAEKYIEHIASFTRNGKITVPEKYKIVYRNNSNDREPTAIISNNTAANYSVCDHNYIYINNKNDLTDYEKYAIMITHTGNDSFNSFAAEVVYHAQSLVGFSSIFVYDNALRADMSVGDRHYNPITNALINEPQYNPNSSLMLEQQEYHGKQ